MDFDVNARTILLVKHGSQAYGLATPTSDLDIKGVCIEPKQYYMGFLNNFEQHEAMVHKGHPEDKVIYSLKKFMRLAADCNPNIIEVLHVDGSDILSMDETGERLRGMKDAFLSKKAKHTFSGYAHAQLKRIRSHREWLLNPPKAPPDRKDFGLSGNRAVSKSDLGAFTELERRTVAEFGEVIIDLPTNVVEILVKEKAFAAAKTTYEQYQNWVKSRNPARAVLEAQFGYDTKHGSHLLRLMRMCKEILMGLGVIVKRPDREEILDVKMGRRPYDSLIDEAERLEAECEALYHTSLLPHSPDYAWFDAQCVDMIDKYLSKNG